MSCSSPSSDSNHSIATSLSDKQPSSLPQVVINTRPVERAAPLTRHLRAAGLTVVDMPMLALQPRAVTEQQMTLMQQWLAGDYKALVIVSPTAAASGLAVWQVLERARQTKCNTNERAEVEFELGAAPSHLIAVGAATAAVLNNAKIEAASYQVLQPEIANNEGMLAMPEIESLNAGDKLLVWRGLGGRRLLVDTLQARGVHIDSIAWYERQMPIDALAQYQQWSHHFYKQNAAQAITPSAQPKPIVVVSSGTAFEHWSSIVKAGQASELVSDTQSDSQIGAGIKHPVSLTLADFAYVVLGERLANMVAEQQLCYWRVEDLAPATILAAIGSKA